MTFRLDGTKVTVIESRRPRWEAFPRQTGSPTEAGLDAVSEGRQGDVPGVAEPKEGAAARLAGVSGQRAAGLMLRADDAPVLETHDVQEPSEKACRAVDEGLLGRRHSALGPFGEECGQLRIRFRAPHRVGD